VTGPAGRNSGRGSQQSRTKTSAGRGQAVRPSSAAVPDRNGAKENHVVPAVAKRFPPVKPSPETETVQSI
jgi:hypothetical protein